MALIGISLIVASVVWVFVRPPTWLPPWFPTWKSSFGWAIEAAPAPETHDDEGERGGHVPVQEAHTSGSSSSSNSTTATENRHENPYLSRRKPDDTRSMPPPLNIPEEDEQEQQTTPKAPPTNSSRLPPIPSFSLDDTSKPPTQTSSMLPPPRPTKLSPQPSSSSSRPPQFLSQTSAQRARAPQNQQPSRGPGCSTLPLAPPPTHSTKPSKPSRAVILTPGHSPLDWARLAHPGADLRGLPPSMTSYLRVTPSMLKKQTGRKGTDAWMGLNGKVYNISPYADFHPGGVPELMRGAGRDGTRLFGEVHPWVNYETMLQPCLVGLLVDESVGEGRGESELDQMD